MMPSPASLHLPILKAVAASELSSGPTTMEQLGSLGNTSYCNKDDKLASPDGRFSAPLSGCSTTSSQNSRSTFSSCLADDEHEEHTPSRDHPQRVLAVEGLPSHLIDVEYSVRGAIVERAEELQRQLDAHSESFTRFHEIIPANIGNPQAVGWAPVSFNRQVMACLLNPSLLKDDDAQSPLVRFPFPEDVKERALRYLNAFPSFGAYSESRGVALFRRDIAEWFERRDGFPCDLDTIYLTDGASPAVRYALELLISDPKDGILIPVPQYPLYSASITRLKGTSVQCFLQEEGGWKLTVSELQRAIGEARKNLVNPKALVVINPGNPAGLLQRVDEMVDVIRFCEREKLVLLADEVYQENVYCEGVKFVSYRKMVKTMGSHVELISFHSSSKSFAGECGLRGGLMQLENIDDAVGAVLLKLMNLSLCANTMGQAMLACILNPPTPNQPSYKLYREEVDNAYRSLKERASYVTERLNALEGVSCQAIDASLYAFPRITLPSHAIAAAHRSKVSPDMLYCMEMLDATGIICVPGSGFKQEAGTYHFRITLLPRNLPAMFELLSDFHADFLRRYGPTLDIEKAS